MWNYNYFVYITTNPDKTVLYVGVTNDIERRLFEHRENRGKRKNKKPGEHVLSRIAFSMLSHLGLIEELSLDPEKLRFFFAGGSITPAMCPLAPSTNIASPPSRWTDR